MNPAAGIHLPLLVNTLGHVAGAATFGVFLYLLWRNSRRTPLSDFWLPTSAACLALLWNVGSLAVLASAESVGWYRQLTVSLSFAVLSLLPGVLLHLSLGTRRLLLRTGGYVLSAAAMATHLSEVFGFGLLAIVAAAALARDRDRRQGASMRVLGAMALFLVAASFFHFGDMHGPSAWTHELFVHHAGIPLALFVLLQDYRFFLLDVFVRFLGSALLAAATAAILIITGNLLGLLDLTQVGGFSQAWLIVALSLTLLAFRHSAFASENGWSAWSSEGAR